MNRTDQVDEEIRSAQEKLARIKNDIGKIEIAIQARNKTDLRKCFHQLTRDIHRVSPMILTAMILFLVVMAVFSVSLSLEQMVKNRTLYVEKTETLRTAYFAINRCLISVKKLSKTEPTEQIVQQILLDLETAKKTMGDSIKISEGQIGK